MDVHGDERFANLNEIGELSQKKMVETNKQCIYRIVYFFIKIGINFTYGYINYGESIFWNEIDKK